MFKRHDIIQLGPKDREHNDYKWFICLVTNDHNMIKYYRPDIFMEYDTFIPDVKLHQEVVSQ